MMPFFLLLLVAVLSNFITAQDAPQQKRAIVIGASIGMGKEVAKRLSAQGYIVGMAARRIELLEQIQKDIPTPTYAIALDAAQPEEAVAKLENLIGQLGGLDLLVIASSGYYDCDFSSKDWKKTLPVLQVDVLGFYALAKTGLNFFEKQGYGHLMGFTSIDGLYGIAKAQAYSAAKAFCIRYLQAEANKYCQKNIPIYVTDVCPGFVNSKGDLNAKKSPHAYWIESLDDAVDEIMQAIADKVPVAYITKRWKKVADLLAVIPADLYNALCARPYSQI